MNFHRCEGCPSVCIVDVGKGQQKYARVSEKQKLKQNKNMSNQGQFSAQKIWDHREKFIDNRAKILISSITLSMGYRVEMIGQRLGNIPFP